MKLVVGIINRKSFMDLLEKVVRRWRIEMAELAKGSTRRAEAIAG